MNILLTALAAGAGLLLAMQGGKAKTIIVDNTKNIIPKKKEIAPAPAPAPAQKTIIDKYLYAKNNTNIYKSYSVNHVKTALTNSKTAIYEGEKWLTGIPTGMYVGLATGLKMNNMIQIKMNLSSKDYLAWVDESQVERSSKYDSSKMKNASIINRIINLY